MEIFSWKAFEHTGDIEAYLLYRSVKSLKREVTEKTQWQTSEQQAS